MNIPSLKYLKHSLSKMFYYKLIYKALKLFSLSLSLFLCKIIIGMNKSQKIKVRYPKEINAIEIATKKNIYKW